MLAAAESARLRMRVASHKINTRTSTGSSSGKSTFVSIPKKDFCRIEPTTPTPSRERTKVLLQGDSFLS